LHPYGTRGIVLTALAAFVLAGAGLIAARNALHAALLADTGADAAATEAADVDHRLHAGLVTTIVAAVVVIAAVISVAVVLSGPSTNPTPPGEGGSKRIAPHAAGAVGSIHPVIGVPGESPRGRVALASRSTSLAFDAGTTVNFINGITLNVPAGWDVTDHDRQSASLLKADHSAGLFIDVGNANTPDIGQESTLLISQNIKSAGLTDVQQYPATPQALQGKNFQQLLEVDYSANIQTDQGTGSLFGGWVTLYNSATHFSGLFNLYAGNHDKFEAVLPDAASMLLSIE
jgi:hypothetical protein